ncbi:preprotein translocase subunit YajC [Nocardia stercoris]|uniref:Preprotein translocase subunit YajC n=1 Tax=Nocardia stercoris TaxID=2483361 RepID=A0A3M2L0W6_9NOCA|nr:preprotein translocase subunit YajC [Nocardia stercoris]RMI30596.1 preprotein translocase subunit YajC [Nocardia stercoris]
MGTLLFPLLLVALMVPLFLNTRRQKREMEKVNAMRDALQVGDRVVTTSGLYGTVVDVDDETIDLEIAEDVVTTWEKAAILRVQADDTAVEPGTGDAAAATDATDVEDEDEDTDAATETAGTVPDSAEDLTARSTKD